MSEVYVDGTTPLNAAHMNGVQQKVEKAAANGYPSLDATGKVPLAQLPPVGADLRYDGDWVAGSYSDGDIVVYQGVAYMAVKPTSAAPTAWPTPGGVGQPTYGTTLPVSPVDGQEAILVDSASNPSYQWRFRYNVQSTSPYKWEFVGGPPQSALVATQEAHTGGATWQDLATPGPLLTIPRSGEYWVEGQATLVAAGAESALVGVTYNGIATPANYAAVSGDRVSDAQTLSFAFKDVFTAGFIPRMRYLAYTTSSFHTRRLRFFPVRVA